MIIILLGTYSAILGSAMLEIDCAPKHVFKMNALSEVVKAPASIIILRKITILINTLYLIHI